MLTCYCKSCMTCGNPVTVNLKVGIWWWPTQKWKWQQLTSPPVCQLWARSVMWTISVSLPLCQIQWRTKQTFNMLYSLSVFKLPVPPIQSLYCCLSVCWLSAFRMDREAVSLWYRAGIRHKNRIWPHSWALSKVNTLFVHEAPQLCCHTISQ